MPRVSECLALLGRAAPIRWYPSPCVSGQPRWSTIARAVYRQRQGSESREDAFPGHIPAHKRLQGGMCSGSAGHGLWAGIIAGHGLSHAQSLARAPPPPPSVLAVSGLEFGLKVLGERRRQTPGWLSAPSSAAGAITKRTCSASASAVAGAAPAAGFLGRWRQWVRAACMAWGSQTLASTSVTLSPPPPLQEGRPSRLPVGPARQNHGPEDAFVVLPGHPTPPEHLLVPPVPASSTSSNDRFLSNPEVAQLSHLSTTSTKGRALTSRG